MRCSLARLERERNQIISVLSSFSCSRRGAHHLATSETQLVRRSRTDYIVLEHYTAVYRRHTVRDVTIMQRAYIARSAVYTFHKAVLAFVAISSIHCVDRTTQRCIAIPPLYNGPIKPEDIGRILGLRVFSRQQYRKAATFSSPNTDVNVNIVVAHGLLHTPASCKIIVSNTSGVATSNGVGRVGKVQGAPSAGAPEFQAEIIEIIFPLH